MSRPRPARFVAIVGLLAVLALGPAASGHHNGTVTPVEVSVAHTVTLTANNYSSYTFSMAAGDAIRYDIRVVSGTEIDVYLVPPDGLSDYVSESAPEFRLFARVENAKNITGSFALDEGILAIIVDNTDLVASGAMPLGPVEVAVGLTREASGVGSGRVLAAVGLVIFGSVLIGAVAVTVLRRRRTGAKRTPSPAMTPTPYETNSESEPPKEP